MLSLPSREAKGICATDNPTRRTNPGPKDREFIAKVAGLSGPKPDKPEAW